MIYGQPHASTGSHRTRLENLIVHIKSSHYYHHTMYQCMLRSCMKPFKHGESIVIKCWYSFVGICSCQASISQGLPYNHIIRENIHKETASCMFFTLATSIAAQGPRVWLTFDEADALDGVGNVVQLHEAHY